MDRKFNVVYTGLQEGVTSEEFSEKFCTKFGISEQKARKIVSSTSDVVVKKELLEKKARQYASAFETCGMLVRLDEISAKPGGLSLEPIAGEEEFVAEDSSIPKCPKCGSEDIEEDECKACGIYISKYLENQENSAVTIDSDSENRVPEAIAGTNMNKLSGSDEGFDSEQNNPYATPEASLENDIVSKDGQGSLEGGINGDYDFTISEIFAEAWERTKGAKGTFLLALLFYIVMAIVLHVAFAYFGPDPELLISQGRFSESMFWSFIPSFVGIPILYPVLAGITLMGIHHSVDADITATSVFNHYGKVIPLSIMGILMGIFIMLGFILLIIPGFYLAIAYVMAMSLMIDRNMGAWEAMETSRKAISKHWFKVFFLYLLLGLLIMVASIPLFLGLIWVLPLAAIMHGVMYKYMFGVESVE